MTTDAPTTHTTQLIDRTGRVDPETMECFTEADFAVGKTIHVLGQRIAPPPHLLRPRLRIPPSPPSPRPARQP